jgi:hypothetical protein
VHRGVLCFVESESEREEVLFSRLSVLTDAAGWQTIEDYRHWFGNYCQ